MPTCAGLPVSDHLPHIDVNDLADVVTSADARRRFEQVRLT